MVNKVGGGQRIILDKWGKWPSICVDFVFQVVGVSVPVQESSLMIFFILLNTQSKRKISTISVLLFVVLVCEKSNQ